MASFSHYIVKNGHQVPELSTAYSGEPTGTFLEQLNRNLKIEITNLTETDIEFDLIGVDASIANALRRILLAEVIEAKSVCLPNVFLQKTIYVTTLSRLFYIMIQYFTSKGPK